MDEATTTEAVETEVKPEPVKSNFQITALNIMAIPRALSADNVVEALECLGRAVDAFKTEHKMDDLKYGVDYRFDVKTEEIEEGEEKGKKHDIDIQTFTEAGEQFRVKWDQFTDRLEMQTREARRDFQIQALTDRVNQLAKTVESYTFTLSKVVKKVRL